MIFVDRTKCVLEMVEPFPKGRRGNSSGCLAHKARVLLVRCRMRTPFIKATAHVYFLIGKEVTAVLSILQ